MLILLPPSEGKTAPVSGAPYSPGALSLPQLTPHREAVLATTMAAAALEDAVRIFGVGASIEPEVRANAALRTAPTAPAHRVYSGVLYDALGYSSLTPTQRRKADASVVVVSALWGAVGFADPLPAYRLSMGVDLPGIGPLATFWRSRLQTELDRRCGDELVIDCRSSTYAAVYKPPTERTVAVDVVQERAGVRKVVSHFAKHTRGELARLLLQRRGAGPRTPRELHRIAAERWPGSELEPPAGSKPHRLVIVLPEDHAFTARG